MADPEPQEAVDPSASAEGARNLVQLLRLEIPVSVVIAKKNMYLEEILNLSTGSVVEFEKSHREKLDLGVGGKTIAQGEAVTLRDKFGIRNDRIGSPQETLSKLGSGN